MESTAWTVAPRSLQRERTAGSNWLVVRTGRRSLPPISTMPGSCGQGGAGGQDEPETTPAVEEILLLVEGDDAAAIDEGDAVGDLLDVEGVVGGEEDGAALVGEDGHELGENFAAGDGIEAGGGLVENEQTRLVGEREQERGFDALAVGEALDLLLRLEVEAAQRACRRRPGSSRG